MLAAILCILGIIILIRGDVEVTSSWVVRGSAARVCAVLLMFPVLLKLLNPSLAATSPLVCLGLVFLIGVMFAGPSDPTADDLPGAKDAAGGRGLW